MKRFFAALCAALLLAGGISARGAGDPMVEFYNEETGQYIPAEEVRQVEVMVDGCVLETDLPAFLWDAVGGDARTMLPVRAVAEALGAKVTWEPEARTVRIARGAGTVVLTLGSEVALVNREEIPLPGGVPAVLARQQGVERTLVPLRFVSEMLGARVDWDGTTRTARVTRAPLTGYTVVLDPGHGGSAPGAVYDGVREKDLNTAIALKAAALLEDRGCKVLLTRSDDRDVGLYERCRMANRAGADLFVSVHANASVTNREFEGTYTYSYPGSAAGEALAQCIQTRVTAAAGSVDRGVETADFVVVRETQMPAALLETGFMSCRRELERLTDPAYQERLARGLADGIQDYLLNA